VSAGDVRTDGELVIALRDEGDTMAFEVLMKRHERPLYGFIVRQLGDRSSAQDVYQQTLLRILDRIDTVSSPEAFRPWAFGIASNLCKNHRRSQPPGHARAELDGLASGLPSPEAATAQRETATQIAQALERLPEAQREVFVLYHYTRLSYEEIAGATGAPLGTVKSRMNAALSQLRTLLASLAEDAR